jgi:uncharacterized protein YbbC (DUF1343 family)
MLSNKKIRNRFIILLLFFANLFLAECSTSGGYYNLNRKSSRVETGLEVFLEDHAHRYRGVKTILVTNHSGVDFTLRQNIGLLKARGLSIILVLAPEHGLYGYQNQFDKNLYIDEKKQNLLIYNLHKLSDNGLKLLLKSAGLVLFDIQDMGMRCYTYISNLKHIMDALKGTKTRLLVLDRPNPISFLGVDGAYLDNGFKTKFVSAFPSPFIYDMTIGEAANYYKHQYAKDVKLEIIEMDNYERDMTFIETGLPWVPPSPNLPTYESSIIYTAVVLMEGINISIGRGTTKPFEYIGAPWLEPYSFLKKIRGLGLKNFRFRPVYFKPTFSHYEGEKCGGVQIFYTGGKFSPTEFSYRVIQLLMKEYKNVFWRKYKRWYSVDHLAGTDLFRKSIDKGLAYKNFHKMIVKDVDRYKKKRKKYLLY